MFHLNVQDSNECLSLRDKTDVGHNICKHAAFHKTVYRHPSKEIDDFDVILFQIYRGILVPKIIQIIDKVIAKIKWCSLFAPYSVQHIARASV